MIKPMNETDLGLLGFRRCEGGKYYRMGLYENTILEIDTGNMFASIVKINNKDKRHPITKICLPTKITKKKLLNLLEIFLGE